MVRVGEAEALGGDEKGIRQRRPVEQRKRRSLEAATIDGRTAADRAIALAREDLCAGATRLHQNLSELTVEHRVAWSIRQQIVELVVLVYALERARQIVGFLHEEPAGVFGEPGQARPRIESDHVLNALEAARHRLIASAAAADVLHHPIVRELL